MENVKIVFDIDTTSVKSSTQDLVALNKVTETEIETLKRLEAESNASKVAFQQLSKELKSANNELLNAKKSFGDTSKEAQAAQKNVDALTDKMAELKQTVKPVEDAFVSLRQRVKEAKEEAVQAAEKYGEFSSQALAAKQKAGQLADQMGDLNRQVNLLNPEAKAKAFSNLAQGVVGAFSVATGALQAFGVKNKEVEALAMKLQGALNITQGIASLKGLKESYNDIKVVLGFTTAAQEALTVANTAEAASATGAAAATRAFTASLLTNPVFLAVAAIAALAGAMIALSDDTDTAKNSQIDFTAENEKLKKALDASKESADGVARAMIDLKVAKGEMTEADAAIAKNNMDLAKSSEEVKNAITSSTGTINAYRKSLIDAKKQYDKDIADAENYAKQSNNVNAAAVLEREKKRAKDTYDLFVKNTKERIKKEQEILKANQTNLTNITAETETKNTTVTTEEANKRTEARKAEGEKAKAEAEKRAQEELALQIKLRNQLQENALAEISDPIERIKQARQFANENYAIEQQRLEDTKASQLERDNLAAEHTALMKKLDNDEVNANKTKNEKVLAAEKKLQDALLALALAQETDPVKRAQIINDAKEEEIDNQLALVEKGSKEEQALLADKARFEIEAQKRIGTAQVEAAKETGGEILKTDEEIKQERILKAKFAVDAINTLNQTLLDAQTQRFSQEAAEVQTLYDKKLITEKQYQDRLRVIKRKEWEANKRASLATAAIGIAQGIINALTIQPSSLMPWAIALAGTVGAVQIATIASQKPPQFAKGTLSVPGIDMGKDSVHAILQPGEAVIPTKTNKAYHPTIKAIYEKKISPSEINNFVMSRTKSGGSSAITANVDTYALTRALGKNKTVEVGNANVIGRAMARELLRGQNYRRA